MTDTFLAIECSSELCSVALLTNGQIYSKEKLAPREHAYLVLPFVDSLMQSHTVSFQELNGIVFGQGPGAFTGLRVAASMAQGLALAHLLPLGAACSLRSLAQQSLPTLPEGACVLSVLDARMSELYWALYKVTAGQLQEMIAPSLSSLADMKTHVESVEPGNIYAFGPGCRYIQEWAICENLSTLEEDAERFPKASDLIELYLSEGIGLESESKAWPMPSYLRNNVAAKPKKRES